MFYKIVSWTDDLLNGPRRLPNVRVLGMDDPGRSSGTSRESSNSAGDKQKQTLHPSSDEGAPSSSPTVSTLPDQDHRKSAYAPYVSTELLWSIHAVVSKLQSLLAMDAVW